MSDVILYPIRGQLVQVKDKNEYIVYVPRADEYTYGTIKIGKGLISDEGVISVDDTQIVAIKTIAKNGVEIKPDENRQVNIVLTKADVGLNNVNNTADLDKPISTATQAAIDKLSHDLMDDVMNVQESLDDYKLVVDNKFAEQKSDVDGRLLVINNTISQNKTQTDSAIERIEEVLEGKEQAVAFNNYQTVVNAFNMAATNKYNVGQSVYVQSVNVPDLWVYSIENTHIDFAYIGDEDIIEKLETNGTVQFGYYKLAMMETKQAVVTGDITTDALLLKLTDSDTVVVSKSGDRVMLSLDATIQNRLSKMLVLPMSNPTTTEIVAVDNTGSQKMLEIGDGLSLENGTLKAVGGSGDVDLSGYLQLSGGTMSGVLKQNTLSLLVGSCSSASTAATNFATVSGNFTLSTGAVVAIEFANAWGFNFSAQTRKLNVNNTGAYTIQNLIPWSAGDIILFRFDGTNWNQLTTNNAMRFNVCWSANHVEKPLVLQGATSTTSFNGATEITLSSYYLDLFKDQTVAGVKNYIGNLQVNGVDVATMNDITGGGTTGNFVTTDTEQTITANKNFVLSSQYTNSNLEMTGDYVSISSKRGTSATVDTNTVFVGDYITRLGGINSSNSFSGIEYDAFDRKTKLIGEVEYNDSKVATSSDIDNAIKTAIQDTWGASY